jgi:hypothetical protein
MADAHKGTVLINLGVRVLEVHRQSHCGHGVHEELTILGIDIYKQVGFEILHTPYKLVERTTSDLRNLKL